MQPILAKSTAATRYDWLDLVTLAMARQSVLDLRSHDREMQEEARRWLEDELIWWLESLGWEIDPESLRRWIAAGCPGRISEGTMSQTKRHRKSHVEPKSPLQAAGLLDPEEEDGEWERLRRKYPWETNREYQMFQVYLLCGPGRSIRKAYRTWCKANHAEPKKDPPSNWFHLARGEFAAFQKADQQREALERARNVYQRVPEWERLQAVAQQGASWESTRAKMARSWTSWSCSILLSTAWPLISTAIHCPESLPGRREIRLTGKLSSGEVAAPESSQQENPE